jgi:hypothetical protein
MLSVFSIADCGLSISDLPQLLRVREFVNHELIPEPSSETQKVFIGPFFQSTIRIPKSTMEKPTPRNKRSTWLPKWKAETSVTKIWEATHEDHEKN